MKDNTFSWETRISVALAIAAGVAIMVIPGCGDDGGSYEERNGGEPQEGGVNIEYRQASGEIITFEDGTTVRCVISDVDTECEWPE